MKRFLVIGPNYCCGCAFDAVVGSFATRDEADAAAERHDRKGYGTPGDTEVIDLTSEPTP